MPCHWYLQKWIVCLFQNYFGDAWNVFDFIIVLGSFIDIVYSEVNVSKYDKNDKKGKVGTWL